MASCWQWILVWEYIPVPEKEIHCEKNMNPNSGCCFQSIQSYLILNNTFYLFFDNLCIQCVLFIPILILPPHSFLKSPIWYVQHVPLPSSCLLDLFYCNLLSLISTVFWKLTDSVGLICGLVQVNTISMSSWMQNLFPIQETASYSTLPHHPSITSFPYPHFDSVPWTLVDSDIGVLS